MKKKILMIAAGLTLLVPEPTKGIEMFPQPPLVITVGEQKPLPEVKQETTPAEKWQVLEVPGAARDFKAQEPYTVFKNQSTVQWKLQQSAWTDADGFRRYGEEGLYMVAVGSYYGPSCGTVLRVTMENGTQFKCVTGDQKANQHTDPRNQYCLHNGSVLEFIVDMNKISQTCRKMGDMSYASTINLKGRIAKIERLVE